MWRNIRGLCDTRKLRDVIEATADIMSASRNRPRHALFGQHASMAPLH